MMMKHSPQPRLIAHRAGSHFRSLGKTIPAGVVQPVGGSDAPGVKAISGRGDITVVSMETVGMWQEVGFLAEAFGCFIG